MLNKEASLLLVGYTHERKHNLNRIWFILDISQW